MKTYFKIVFSIALILGLITITQTLLSEPSNVEAATGLLLAVLLCPITYFLTKWCIGDFFKPKGEK